MLHRKQIVIGLSLLFIISLATAVIFSPQLQNCLLKREYSNSRFVVISDTRGSSKSGTIIAEEFSQILNQIKKLKPQPAYIVFPGDLVVGSRKVDQLKSQLESWKCLVSSYYPIERVLPTVGNHEVGSNPKKEDREKAFASVFTEFQPDEWLEGYNRTVYYKDIGTTRLILLNTYHYGEGLQITGAQLEWLKKVACGPQRHTFVAIHAPAYPTGAHLNSSLDLHPEKRDEFWKVIDENNIDVVFTGHEHNYSRTCVDSSFSTKDTQFKNKINQVVAGSAGAGVTNIYLSEKGVIVPPIPVMHFVVVDIMNGDVIVKAISIEGETIDEFVVER